MTSNGENEVINTIANKKQTNIKRPESANGLNPKLENDYILLRLDLESLKEKQQFYSRMCETYRRFLTFIFSNPIYYLKVYLFGSYEDEIINRL